MTMTREANPDEAAPPPAPENVVVRLLRLIRFSHTVFALPFALGALIVATGGHPPRRLLFLVLGCMIFARTAAMLFNRVADWSFDQRNPRTRGRQFLVSKRVALGALLLAIVGFVLCSGAINTLTFALSPVALLLIFFYSLTKRFTDATHFFLGFALAAAPVGAWIAATSTISFPPLILGLGVVFWVAGFDLIYSTQDYEFDRREGLHSMVVRLGLSRSLRLAQLLHLLMFFALFIFGMTARLGSIYFWCLPIVAGALLYEHRAARRRDLAAINRAFFRSNAFVSVVFLAAVWLDCLY